MVLLISEDGRQWRSELTERFENLASFLKYVREYRHPRNDPHVYVVLSSAERMNLQRQFENFGLPLSLDLTCKVLNLTRFDREQSGQYFMENSRACLLKSEKNGHHLLGVARMADSLIDECAVAVCIDETIPC